MDDQLINRIAQGIVDQVGASKLHRLDAEDPEGFDEELDPLIGEDEPYEKIRARVLDLIGAYDPPRESKQNEGGAKVRITESRLREIIKEEIQLMVEEETKTLDGEALPVVRLVGPNGLGGVASAGQNVIITKGFPGTPADQFQLHVLPRNKVIGQFKTIEDAMNLTMTGERYYASADEILKNSKPDTAQPGSARDRTVTVNV